MNQVKRLAAAVLAGCLTFSSIPVYAAHPSEYTNGETQITGLTTEYLKNPIGIDTNSIHFGWKMLSSTIGAKQTAYQVIVTAADNSGNVAWDSGKVESDRSTGIVCQGSLQEGTVYQWEVIVWNEYNETYSNSASFETGVTNQQEWADAEFIRLNASPIAPIFRTEQDISGKISKARLYITSLGSYQAFVNGSQVGEFDDEGNVTYHHMNPGYGNGNISLGYQTYDVTPFLSGSDKAAISVVAGTGWYNGMGNTTSRPAVKALMVIDYSDGGRKVIQTNTTDWKGTLEGGITGNGIVHGEDYNACFAEELGDFTQVGYDDSKWVNSEEGEEETDSVPYLENKFTPQTASYVRVLVKETGPADNKREHLLQIMELELLDEGGNNVVLNKVPEVSNSWSPNGQWSQTHLTDGDLGIETDKGFTTTLLGNQGQKSFALDEPISITFALGEDVNFQTLKMYPRTSVESVSKNECANYPKKYCLQISADGEIWTDVNISNASFRTADDSMDVENEDVKIEDDNTSDPSAEEMVPIEGDEAVDGDTQASVVRMTEPTLSTANKAEIDLEDAELQKSGNVDSLPADQSGIDDVEIEDPVEEVPEETDVQEIDTEEASEMESESEFETESETETESESEEHTGREARNLHWEDANAYYVQFLRNNLLFPEINALNYGTDFEDVIQAKHVKISVTELGPAVNHRNDYERENRLQLMELELLDGQNNVVQGVVPTISHNFEGGSQWNAANLTDGDYGHESDSGFTSDILGVGEQFLKLDEPVTIQFDFENEVSFSSLKIYPRISLESISFGVCANYPKVYTVQISEDGNIWTDVTVDQENGMVRNTTLFQNTKMSTAEFPGSIRAQAGTAGKLIDTFDQYPVSAVLYTDVKAESSYPAGEIDVQASHSASAGENVFGDGVELKKGQKMIVNMGQNLSAVPQIQFEAQKGTKATLKFAEMLNDGSAAGSGATQADGPKGSIYLKNLRNARSTATYIFAGDGLETYQPSMSFFGYQYVQITASDDITVHFLSSKAISSVTEKTGNINTNNEDVNKLFSNALYGQLSNYVTTPTDCNQRDERLSWTGDTQAFAQTAVYNFDSVAFLNDMQDIYNENTRIKGYVPAVADIIDGFFSNWAAGWSDVLIVLPWVTYLQTGDEAALTENWDTLVHYMDYMKSIERGANQAPTPDTGRNYGDWLSFQGTSVEVINDYYYGYMHQIMAKIAGVVGNKEKETEYSQKFEAIKDKFIETHVVFENGNLTIKSKEGNTNLQFQYGSGKEGVWENNSQTSLIWMLKLGFYDSEEMRDAALKLLLENIKNENPDAGSVRAKYAENTLAVGFLGSNVITPLLTEIGSSDVSYDLLLQDQQPSWLFEVKAGATTVWERWDSYTPGKGFGHSEMNSFNHYAYGSVVEWMYKYMAGISADEENPGFKNIILQPTLDTGEQYNSEARINAVDASYDSYYGTIQSSWTSSAGKLSAYHVTIPANTTATLYLPVEKVAVDGFANIKGVTFVGIAEHNNKETAEIQLESGSYDFDVHDGKVSVDYPGGGGKPESTVTSVKVLPASAEVEKGLTKQFTAEVTGENSPAQTVTWTLEGNNSSNTKISSEGLLSVASDEKSAQITVKAASTIDPAKSGTAKVTVKDKVTPPTPPTENKVTSISVKAKASKIFVKEKTTVQAAVLPANAKNKSIEWSSSNTAIASVSSEGAVTGKKAGSVKIRATAADGSKVYGECTIKVVKPTVKLNVKSAKLQVKKSTKVIKASGLQSGDKVTRWSSSKKSVATVDKKGRIKAKKVGTTRITVYTKKGAKATMKLTVTKKPVKTKKIKANVKKLTLKKGKTYKLSVTRSPITATEKITYASSKKSVATVSRNGKITAKKKGKATITIKTSNNKKAKVRVTVK